MKAILLLLPIALALGGLFVFLFVLAVKDRQFEDLDDPPLRMLGED